MNRAIVFLLCVLPVLAIGQVTLKNYHFGTQLFEQRSEQENMLYLGGSVELGSSGVNAAFVNRFLYSKAIENELKDQVSNALKANNRLGFELDAGITWVNHRDSVLGGPGTFRVGIRMRNMAGMLFTKDAFDLAFYGNKRFAGEEADLGKTKLDQYRFNEVSVGWTREWRNEGQATFEAGAGVSLLQGTSHTELELGRGTLYTEAEGQYLDLDLQMITERTDTDAVGTFAMNGFGAAIDLYFGLNSERSIFRIDITDVGMIAWNNKSIYYQQDTAFRFIGYEATNILDLENGIPDIADTDSLLELANIDHGKRGYNTWLPVMVSATYLGHLSDRILVMARASFRQNISMIPSIQLKGTYLAGNSGISVIQRYGGWGGYSFGVEYQYAGGKQLFTIGSNALQGFIMPEGLPGSALYLRFATGF